MFLIGQTGLGENATNAIANIGGMALSFLGGTWVPIEWLPDAVARAARLTPGYWVNQALSGAYSATSTSAHTLLPLLVDCGICALFALALLAVAMGVRRTRARSGLCGGSAARWSSRSGWRVESCFSWWSGPLWVPRGRSRPVRRWLLVN